MDESGSTSLFGPAMFVGLSVFAIVTQGEPRIDSNPLLRIEPVAFDDRDTVREPAASLPQRWHSAVDEEAMPKHKTTLHRLAPDALPRRLPGAMARPIVVATLPAPLSGTGGRALVWNWPPHMAGPSQGTQQQAPPIVTLRPRSLP